MGYPQWLDGGLPVEKTTYAAHSIKPPISDNQRPIKGWGLLLTLVGIFLGGMALNLTPCVYPIIPITVSYFAGQSEKQQSRRIVHGLCYVTGLALINSILGVTAALTGGLMGAILQHPAVLILIAVVLACFASSLFGFWEMRMPYALTQMASRSYAGYFGSLFMGATMGVVAAPCIGPFVLGLLTLVAGLKSIWLGFIFFFTLSLGLGLPLFVLALFSGQVQRLPRSGEWMIWVRKLMGWVLVGMAVYYLRALVPRNVHTFLLAALAVAAGLHLGWVVKIQAQSGAFQWIRSATGSVGLVLATVLICGWLTRGPGVDWKPYSEELIISARRDKRPVIIDFYADWCTPCVELEQKTFHDPKIAARSKGEFILIKVDLTRDVNPIHEHLLQQYNVRGVPTVVFIGPDGTERKELRLVDFLPAALFLSRMDALNQKDRH
jgi:thiol:disulfide interchange protein DsbD